MNLPTFAIPKIEINADLSKPLALSTPIGAIVISLAILIFVVWPKFSQILKIRADNQQLAVRANNLELKASTIASLDKTDLDAKLGIVEQLLPSDKGVFPVVRQIESTASFSGVILNRVDLSPGSLKEVDAVKGSGAQGASQDPAPKVQLKIAVTSDYKSFQQFLTNIFALSRVMAVKELSISTFSASGGQSSQIRASLTIDAFWQPLPKELNSIESPIEDLTSTEQERLDQVRTTGLISAPVLPQVPIGRGDLFAPF